ncbi:hypothetical protein C8J56DRAFT_304838 [Mycena floridula]|nr:hypothetical protein C8J56DRAFT_304838 [Mycena floridula]
MASVPKAALYYSLPESLESVWSAAVRITLEEKGYGQDELDLRPVNTDKGEQFSPTFLRLSSKAMVPTLIAPFESTLSDEVESRYKAITETKAIVEFLDKSRSPMSRTHTTSSAPAYVLTPATIQFSVTSNVVIEALHSEMADPKKLLYLNARDDAALGALASKLVPLLTTRQEGLIQFIENGDLKVSDKVKAFWQGKKTEIETLLDILTDAQKPKSTLSSASLQKREEYLGTAKVAWDGLKTVLEQLTKEIIGPFVLGEQISIADMHFAPWLTFVFVDLCGAKVNENGEAAVAKLAAHIQGGIVEVSKLAIYWDSIKERQSWKNVYATAPL